MFIWNSNTSFLLIHNWNGTDSLQSIKDQYKLYFEGKQHFEILFFTEVKRPKENFQLPSRTYVISKSDFNLFGKLKSKRNLPTEYTHFDIAILLDEFSSKQDNIIKSMNIKHLVSFGYEREFVNINLTGAHQKPIEKIIFAKELITKISD